jgi:hypothetical protein
MATIQTRAISQSRIHFFAKFAVVMLVSACSADSRQGREDCLKFVEDSSTTEVEAYDIGHDFIDGQYLSCQLLTTASQMHQGMAQIATALQANDIDALARMSLPLLFINQEDVKIEIRTIDDLREWYSVVFDKQTRERIIHAQLDDLSITRNEGASLGNGWVWYVVSEIGGLARLSTINHSVHAHSGASGP